MKKIARMAAPLVVVVLLAVHQTILAAASQITDPLRIECDALKKKIAANTDFQMYNVLSIDGGGIRGLIPGYIIDELETVAFDHAKERGYTKSAEFQKCFQYEGRDGRIAMKDIFDMIAGTSTGSIIAAGITYPQDVGFDSAEAAKANEWIPKFWGFDVKEIYSKKGNIIFKEKEGMSTFVEGIFCVIYMVIFGVIGYLLGRRWFDNPRKDQMFKTAQKLIDAGSNNNPDQSNVSQTDINMLQKDSRLRRIPTIHNQDKDVFESFKVGFKKKLGEQFDKLSQTNQNQLGEMKNAVELQLKQVKNTFKQGRESLQGGQTQQQMPQKGPSDKSDIERQPSNQVQQIDTERSLNNQRHTTQNDTEEVDKNELDFPQNQQVLGQLQDVIYNEVQTQLINKQRDSAQEELDRQRDLYERRRVCKWLTTIMVMFIGSFFLVMFTRMVTFATNSLYDRSAIEDLMNEMVGRRNISQAISDELMITSYEYNSQDSRLYSKYLAELDPDVFDLRTSFATGSSSAAPGFFEPQQFINGFQQRELLIDGGIIANNPALLSYMFATHLKEKENVRVLSLGTGMPTPVEYDLDNWNMLDYKMLQVELMIDIDVYMADQQLKKVLRRQAKKIKETRLIDIKNYLRLQCITDLPMDQSDQGTINGLLETGKQIFETKQKVITEMIQQIVDEKFGYFKYN